MRRRDLFGQAVLAAAAGCVPAPDRDESAFRTLESFGASGDGETDDTGAFAAALDWERAGAGNRLALLRGGATYRATRTLRFDFDAGGLLCLDGRATIRFTMDAGNGVEVYRPEPADAHVGRSAFRGVDLLSERTTADHAWYYRRARNGHVAEDCGAKGRWNHAFHYDNGCFGNNLLARPHLELGGYVRVGIWIGSVCNGLRVLHAEINNPAEGGVEIDATARSDIGEGPGVNSVVLDHVMTYNCGRWHLRMNGARAVSVRSPRLESGRSAAPHVVLGDAARCRAIAIDTAWFQGSRVAAEAIALHDADAVVLTAPTFRNFRRSAIAASAPGSASGLLLIRPVLEGTPSLLPDGASAGATVI